LTNIGPAHLEGFGSLEGVRKTKLELFDYISVAVANADDTFLIEGIHSSGFTGRVVRYGIQETAEVFATDITLTTKGSVFLLHITKDTSIEVNPKLSGRFNIYNVLAAASVGFLFDIDPGDIKRAIESFEGVPMRFEIRELNGLQIISDVYNANPASIEEAIRELVRLRKGRAIAILGDMLELGSYAEEAHRKIGRLLSELAVDVFIAVGPLMSLAASEFSRSVYTVPGAPEAGNCLKSISKDGDTILIKGSRGMMMEKVLEAYNAL
ncbi:MAG: UDP-N-acetylmuramoyl-tripeptide--D-alanyl-D-alanine ligase, partial [Nitrospira sp.]|nr:UDP-N-acetylmuramoyl-tripeptide--D-alanyl-D-alanine ligase [Nitrospira sp.]